MASVSVSEESSEEHIDSEDVSDADGSGSEDSEEDFDANSDSGESNVTLSDGEEAPIVKKKTAEKFVWAKIKQGHMKKSSAQPVFALLKKSISQLETQLKNN